MKALTSFCSVMLLLAMGALGCASTPAATPESESVRIGVYDSRAIAVGWGYHGIDDDGPASWGADAIIAGPLDVLDHLQP